MRTHVGVCLFQPVGRQDKKLTNATHTGYVYKMAAEVQTKLKAIKSKSPKVVTEKYQEVFDQLVAEQKDPQQLQEGVEAFLTAGIKAKGYLVPS